ncbi:MAG: acetate--CoA ligase family protein, partial [Deltaproteobacteria bacterium]|nr:acetate--CoA ligase family protein [Deltaproteobacteria bacterium]
LSQMLCDFPQIKEIDVNPLRVFPEGKGCTALDTRMIVR